MVSRKSLSYCRSVTTVTSYTLIHSDNYARFSLVTIYIRNYTVAVFDTPEEEFLLSLSYTGWVSHK